MTAAKTKTARRQRKTAILCPVHTGSIHGGEAEELRAGVETLIESASPHGMVHRTDLQRLLDRVDARDSLAHLEIADARMSEAIRLAISVELGKHDNDTIQQADWSELAEVAADNAVIAIRRLLP